MQQHPIDLARAVADGVISAQQAERLATYGPPPTDPETMPDPSNHADNERFRVLGGFSDIFVALGLALLYGAILIMAQTGSLGPLALAVISAAAAWGLSEVFSRRMRLALPSILLALAFAGSVLIAVFFGFIQIVDGSERLSRVSYTRWLGLPGFLAGSAMLGAAWLHFKRFGVPINWAIGAGGAILMALALIIQIFGIQLLARLNDLAAVMGFAVFGVAMWLDMSDPRRVTTRSDSAFWLHLLAAPMIVHPLIGGYLWGDLATRSMVRSAATPDMWVMLTVIALFAVMAVVSLIIDRRALLVSGLSYTGIAIAIIMNRLGFGGGQAGLILTLLILAAIVLSLSAFWQTLRRMIVPKLPLGRWRETLPPA